MMLIAMVTDLETRKRIGEGMNDKKTEDGALDLYVKLIRNL